MTTVIQLNLPPQAKVTGALRSRTTVQNLLQDMLQIVLPDDIVIDVGWYPDWDPNGRYRVMVFQDDVDHPLEDDFTTKDVDAVKARIYDLVEKYLPFAVSVSDSHDTATSLSLNGQSGPSAEYTLGETSTEASKVTV